IYLLNRIRTGFATTDDLDELNKRFTSEQLTPEFAIVLTSINAIADNVNLKKLHDIKTQSFAYKGEIEGTFNERLCPAGMTLHLKPGAQVMMVKNDLQGRWVNGSIGKIVDLNQNEIK